MEDQREELLRDIPTPRKGDVLFGPDSSLWHLDAVLDFRPGKGYAEYAYREGYRRAGRILTERVAEHRGEQDVLVFPICHAYRHFVELMLKRLIRVGCSIIGRELTERESKLCSGTHNLRELWVAFSAMEKELEAETGTDAAPKDDMDGIEDYIAQLHAVDAQSFSFRYPVTKSGQPSIDGVTRINLGRFCERMESLCSYLEGFDAYYGHLEELEQDVISDYAPDYGGDVY